MALGTGWSLALRQDSEGGHFHIPVGLLSWEAPGLSHSHSLPPPTPPAHRAGQERSVS